MPNPKKLELFLVDGEPDGKKVINLLGWKCHCLIFPRIKLKEIGDDESLKKPGVYFLFGRKSEDNLTISTYIGKFAANNILDRLNFHNRDKEKDFWHMTVVFTSNDIDGHQDSLETQCIALAREVKHFGYVLINKNKPNQQPTEINNFFIKEFADNINLILATIGYPVLQKIEPKNEDNSDSPLFYCQRGRLKTKGTGRMTNEGFVLYEGSVITSKHSPAVEKRNNKKIEELLEEKIIKKDGGIYIFKKDYIFSRPSFPASLILGFAKDGWHAWKTKNGETLDKIYRQAE